MFEKRKYDDSYECNMQMAAALTGIERLFTILDNGTIALRTSAFPTAAQLNSSEYVEAHSSKKRRLRPPSTWL
jgi:hypothetical protein